MYNTLKEKMIFKSVRTALQYIGIDCNGLNKSTLRLLLNCYCTYSYISKMSIKIDKVFETIKKNIYLDEINNKYKNFYKVANGGNCLSIKAFNDLCSIIDDNNGELLSDYINSETNIKFRIYNMVLNRLPSNIKNTIKSINNIKEKTSLNGDKIIKFYSNDNIVVHVNILTYDNANINIQIFGYTNFLIGRATFNKLILSNNHSLLSPYYNSTTKVLVDFKCGHPPNYITPNEYINGNRCKFCCNSIIEKDINSIFSTDADSLIYFKNIEDSYTHSRGSNDVIIFKCPNCGFEKNMSIAGFFYFGFSCDSCSDGISYPNKFITNLLLELEENFQTEVKFDWCRFEDYNNKYKTNYGLYDVVVENKKLIIEMDGKLGHGGYIHSKSNTSKDETLYKYNMKEILATTNGYKVIRIDCKYKGNQDRYEHIIYSLKNSELSTIYDLSSIDYLKIHKKCLTTLIKECCNLWNSGYSTNQISSIIHKSIPTIIKYLNDGNKLNWCIYNKDIAEKNRIKIQNNITAKPCIAIKDNFTIGYYISVSECSRLLSQKYGMNFISSGISSVCRHKHKHYHHFIFQYITKQEFNNYKQTSPELCFGDFFVLDNISQSQVS